MSLHGFKEALARMVAVLDKTLANWTQDEIRDTNATDYQGSSQKSCTKTTGNQTENVREQSEIIDIEAPLYEERSFKGGVLDLDDEAGEKSFGDGVLNLDKHQEPLVELLSKGLVIKAAPFAVWIMKR